MSILSWGKCTIKHCPSVGGAPAAGGAWTILDTPKEDTTKITTSAGSEKSATEEGGGLVDFVKGKNTYQFEFDLFVKKGVARPFVDDDGIISGEHSFRVVPEDASCEGAQIDRCVLSVEESYSTADGILLHYVGKCLRPASGKTVKPYTEGGLVITPTVLYFSGAADSTGKGITATSTGNVSASSTESWATVTCSGKVATVKVSSNTTGSAREAYVTVSADGKSSIVKVLQIPS